jgi:cell division protein FtsW
MAKRLKSDGVLFGTTLLLLFVSMAWVYSASVIKATEKFHDPAYFAIRQGMWIALGMVGLLAAMRIDYRYFRNRKALLWAAGTTALALVLVLVFGRTVNGARRWIGFGSLGIQPSELSKLVAIFFVATVLARRMEEHEPLEPGLLQSGILVVLFAVLIGKEPDFGTAIVLLAATFAMMFAAGIPYRWLLTMALMVPPPVFAVLWFSTHSRQRLQTYMDPYKDPLGAGYQTIQSWIAVGTGGIWGKGFTASVQKMFYLPEPHNDYIFAVIAEEMGLIGATFVVVCFGVLIARGLGVARRAPDAFGSLVALGITSMIAVQALVNLGVVTGLLPAKGIPLPFVSAGGSSMLVSLVSMGVLLNISQQASATE